MLNIRLKELRQKNKITQEELAQIIGVERSSIGKYESPTKPVVPSSDIIMRLADYFNVSTDYLFGRDEKGKKIDEQLEGVDFALFGEIHDLTDKEKEDILNFVKFTKSQRGEKQ